VSPVSQNPEPSNPTRRDDLIVMLRHGGARTDETAKYIVDAYQAEVLLDAASKVIARVKTWDGMSTEAESLNRERLAIADLLRRIAEGGDES
jgi:hypothetical protein